MITKKNAGEVSVFCYLAVFGSQSRRGRLDARPVTTRRERKPVRGTEMKIQLERVLAVETGRKAANEKLGLML
jgi:hypothetical protein